MGGRITQGRRWTRRGVGVLLAVGLGGLPAGAGAEGATRSYPLAQARRAVVYAGRSARGTLYLSQPLYTFGRITGSIAQAEADLAVAEAAAVEMRQTVLAEVTQRYAETVFQGRMFALQLYEGGLLRAQVQTARATVSTARWDVAAEQERVETETRAQWEYIEGLASAAEDFSRRSMKHRRPPPSPVLN